MLCSVQRSALPLIRRLNGSIEMRIKMRPCRPSQHWRQFILTNREDVIQTRAQEKHDSMGQGRSPKLGARTSILCCERVSTWATSAAAFHILSASSRALPIEPPGHCLVQVTPRWNTKEKVKRWTRKQHHKISPQAIVMTCLF